MSPVLSVLGLLLAVLARPGIKATADIITTWNARQLDVLERHPALSATMWGWPSADRVTVAPRKLSSAACSFPGLFALAWITLTVVALVIRH